MNEKNKEIQTKFLSDITKTYIKSVSIITFRFLAIDLYLLTLLYLLTSIGIEIYVFWAEHNVLSGANSFLVENRTLITSLTSMLLMTIYYISLYFDKRNENKVICLPDLRENKE